MNIDKCWKKQAMNHADSCYPDECCGIVAIKNNKEIYWKCKNIAHEYKATSFVIDPDDWIECEDSVDEIVGIVHSHPEGEFKFSDNDIASCNYLDVPFYLVEPTTQSIIHIEPQET
jgi:proteasome lid subunit RPN8/RPN11